MWTCAAEEEADAPESDDALLCGVPPHWNTSDELEALALVQLFAEGDKLGAQGGQTEIILVHVLQ